MSRADEIGPARVRFIRPRWQLSNMHWWESGWLWIMVAIGSTIPLWWPQIPPLVDLPGHLGRYRVQLDGGSSETLRQYFSLHWALIGNLGVDLLIIPLAPMFGLEGAVKLIVMTVPALTVAGIYCVAREVHGRAPASALFAVPFLYNFPFNFGFINFALSMACALLGLALWLRLARSVTGRLRAVLFVPISCLIWLIHAFGWAFLVLTAWSAELIRRHDEGHGFIRASVKASVDCLPLCIPIVLMIFWRSGAPPTGTGGFFGLTSKIFSLVAALRDRWLLWDAFSVAVAVVLVGAAVFDKRLELSRKLAIPAGVLTLVFLLMPTSIFGAAYADMRLAPFMLILAVLAVRFRNADDAAVAILAILAVAFVVLRLAGTTVSYAIADREIRSHTAALDHIQNGARILSLVGDKCGKEWKMPRHAHLGSLVIARKHGFSNDQWQLPGTQLLHIHYPPAGDFDSDPSEIVYSRECLDRTLTSMKREREILRLRGIWADKPFPIGRSADRAIREFPRGAFDYVWVLEAPDFDMKERPGLTVVWRSTKSVLYRVDSASGSAG